MKDLAKLIKNAKLFIIKIYIDTEVNYIPIHSTIIPTAPIYVKSFM